jgi:hypothetical protein
MIEIKEELTNPAPRIKCRLFGHKWLAEGFLPIGIPIPGFTFKDYPPLYKCQRCPATHQRGGLIIESRDKIEITNIIFGGENKK